MIRLGVLFALVMLASCTDSAGDFQLIRNAVMPNAAAFDPRFQALAQTEPPAMQVLLVDQDAASLVLLESTREGIDTWLTPDGAGLITQSGLLRGARGFGDGFLASEIAPSVQLVRAGRSGQVTRFHSYLQGDDTVATRAFACQIEDRGARSVTIGGIPTSARLLAEACQNPTQSFTNLYWRADASGQIVQTRQWMGPMTGTISTRVVPRP